MNKINLIYLMGTGRSGTTALATILGNSDKILTLGEINQFYKEITFKKELSNSYWNEINQKLNVHEDYKVIDQFVYKHERHLNAFKYTLNCLPKERERYQSYLNELFFSIKNTINSDYYLDSSKYVARAILIKQNPNINLKVISVSRDVRGLIWSFNKKVQTQNSPAKTIVYYYLVNTLTLVANWYVFNKQNLLKIRYEDLVESPVQTLNKIGEFLEIDLHDVSKKIEEQLPINVPDVIGGNRLVKNKQIVIRADFEWRKKMPFLSKTIYYFLTLPFNLIYKYKI